MFIHHEHMFIQLDLFQDIVKLYIYTIKLNLIMLNISFFLLIHY